MESKSTSSCHSKSKNPSPSPSTSRSHSKSSISELEVEKKNTEHNTEIPNKPDHSSSYPPELQTLIHKLQGIYISQEESELSQGSVTSHLTPSQRLNRAQSENLGIPPVEFPLTSRKKARKTPAKSQSDVLSSSSFTIPSISSQVHSSIPQLQIVVHTGDGEFKIDPSKVEVIVNWPKPNTAIEVRSFLGAVQYWRKFIAKFSLIAAPLHALKSVKQVFQWRGKQQKAFDTLKERISTTPVLALPDLQHPFGIETDASEYAMGTVLMQHRKAICFHSETFTSIVVNYPTYDKELYALV
eukprot:PITA_21418